MGPEQDNSRKTIDNRAFIVVLVLISAFGITILSKDWQIGVVFFGVLGFAVIAVRKKWFANKIFHD